ncbi:MAG TPA: hypothetical protein VGR10_02525 [Thermoleophilaceae bacterium]|nr:hypothetical protein [Thermoleophilaceae bacterium]
MSHHEAHGIAADLPPGWHGQVYRRRDEDDEPGTVTAQAVRGGATFHAATVPLEGGEADFGSSVTVRMGRRDIFLSLFEYTVDEHLTPGVGLFEARGTPWPLEPGEFRASALQVAVPGQAGLQRFFTVGERPFCLYVVIGSQRRAARRVRAANQVLESIRIEPGPLPG